MLPCNSEGQTRISLWKSASLDSFSSIKSEVVQLLSLNPDSESNWAQCGQTYLIETSSALKLREHTRFLVFKAKGPLGYGVCGEIDGLLRVASLPGECFVFW